MAKITGIVSPEFLAEMAQERVTAAVMAPAVQDSRAARSASLPRLIRASYSMRSSSSCEGMICPPRVAWMARRGSIVIGRVEARLEREVPRVLMWQTAGDGRSPRQSNPFAPSGAGALGCHLRRGG